MQEESRNALSRRSFIVGAAAVVGGGLLASGCSTGGAAAREGSVAVGHGSATGKNGELSLAVIVEDGAISDIVIERSHETEGVGKAAQDKLKEMILADQTLDIDVVSGATLTSMAYLKAVRNALDDTGLDAARWEDAGKAAFVREAEIPTTADMVVIGSGGAGLSAAITAANAGKSVVVFEKLATVGGSSALSGAGYAAPGTWSQIQAGVVDSPEIMAQDMLIGGDNLGDPALVKRLCDNALDSVEWLTYQASVAWEPGCVQDGGHSVARSIIPVGNGAGVVSRLHDCCDSLKVPVCTDVTVTKIMKAADGSASGVVATDNLTGETFEVSAPVVVLATGGFGSNVEMRMKYVPEFDEAYKCTDCVGVTGDGLSMAQELGANLVGMEYIQTHPTGDPQTGVMLGVGSVRVCGCAVMVNKEGKRFVEELQRRDVCSKAEASQTGGVGYFVTTKQGLTDNMWDIDTDDEIQSMIARGIFSVGDTLEEACAPFGIDVDALKQTLDTWNADCKTGTDTQFAYRADMFPIEEAPYCIFPVCPTIHYTMGGVAIDSETHVLDASGKVIPGLYAAGEVTGGIMGSNRLGETSFPDVIINGRTAGSAVA